MPLHLILFVCSPKEYLVRKRDHEAFHYATTQLPLIYNIIYIIILYYTLNIWVVSTAVYMIGVNCYDRLRIYVDNIKQTVKRSMLWTVIKEFCFKFKNSKERKFILIDYKDIITCSAAHLTTRRGHDFGFKDTHFVQSLNIGSHALHHKKCWHYEVLGVGRNDSLVQ
jgi:hypothetical protein